MTTPGAPLAKDLASLSIGVIVNTASGSGTDSTAIEIAGILAEAGIYEPRMWSVAPSELSDALAEAQDVDLLIVFGGDGTIRSAALASSMDGPILLLLPGGTMNLLPKALYGEVSWEAALQATLRDPMVRTISGGTVGTERFFIAAILGAPALWTKAREALREGNLAEALDEGKHALEGMFSSKIAYHFDELNEGTAEVVAVTCPLVSSALADDRRVLEAAVIDVPGAGELFELATAAALGQWRDARNVGIVNTKRVQVSSTTKIPVIVDGEMIHGAQELVIEYVPNAFRVLVPAV